MSATIRRLSVLGPDNSRIGVVELGTGRFTVTASDHRVKTRLEKLFGGAFDESVGFPPKRIQARQGTLEAFEAAVEYVQRALGFECSLVSVSSFDMANDALNAGPISTPEAATGGGLVTIRRSRLGPALQHA